VARGQVNIGRVMYQPPWALTRPWLMRPFLGTDEWCCPAAGLVLPFFLGAITIYYGRRREMPCTECWQGMDDDQRADYLPGGCMEGGRWWPGRIPA
jgi:hypothetical protein